MRLAIVRLTAMGDVIHTMAALQFIRERVEDIHITWFVEEKFADILKDSPDVDKIVPINMHKLKERFSLSGIKDIYRTIKNSGDYDLVIDVQGLIKSAIVARVAGDKVAGLDYESARESISSFFYKYRYFVDCSDIAPMRFASLISKALGISITKKMLLQKSPYLYFEENGDTKRLSKYFKSDKKSILIVTGTSNDSKTYPPERFAEVANLLKEYQILLVAGNEKERKLAKIVEQNSNAELLEPLNLNSLKFVVSKCDLLIGGDTGPSHMAWAMNKPSIILFGSTPKSMMMETPINIAITSGVKVDPCRFDKKDRSITTIDPKVIAEKAKEVLS
jgi:heptosyltransferase-1